MMGKGKEIIQNDSVLNRRDWPRIIRFRFFEFLWDIMRGVSITLLLFLFFSGFIQAETGEFLGASLSDHARSVEDLMLTYGNGPDAFSAGIFLLEFLNVRQNNSVWVSLSPKAKPFTLVSPVLADSLVGKRLLEYDLRLKRDAMEWLGHQGEWKGNSLFRCWIEPRRVLVEKDRNGNLWVVSQVDLLVRVEVLGQRTLPDWAVRLKEHLTIRVNHAPEYAGLRDIVRAWALSRFVVGHRLDPNLSSVSWSKLKILKEYKGLFGEDSIVGGIVLGKVEVEEQKGGGKSYNWKTFSDYFGLGFYNVRFLDEEWRYADADSIRLQIFLGGEQKAEYLAKLIYDFDGIPEEFLRGIFEDFFSKESSEALLSFVKENLRELQRLRIFSFPDKGHDLYGLSTLSKDKETGMILLSEDCFEGTNLNKKGRYVLIYKIIEQALSSKNAIVEIRYTPNSKKSTGFEVVLKSPNSREVLLRREDIEKLFSSKPDKERWKASFSPVSFLGNFAKVVFSGSQKERSVNRLIMAILARNRESIRSADYWMKMGHRFLFNRLEAMEGELQCFRTLNNYLLEHQCPVHLRLDIIRELKAQDFSSDDIADLLEFLDLAYDCLGPHILNPLPKDERWLKWAHKKFWSGMYRSIVYYRGLIAKNKEHYEDAMRTAEEWLMRYQKEGKEWAVGYKPIQRFYSNLGTLFTSPRDIMAWNILNQASLMPLISPFHLIYQFLTFSSDFLGNQVFTYPNDIIDNYNVNTGELTLDLENTFLLSIPTRFIDRWNSQKLVDFVETMVVIPELKRRLKDLIREKTFSVEIRSFDFIPMEAPLHLDLKNRIIFLPEAVVGSKDSSGLKDDLILLGLLEFAFQEGMSIRDLVSLNRIEKKERLLWRYGYNLYLGKEEMTRGLSWFFWLLNMRERSGEDYREKTMYDLLFYQGRTTMLRKEHKEQWWQWKKRQAMIDGRESFWTEKILPTLAYGKPVSSSQYNKTLFRTISMLRGIASGKGSIYEVLKDRPWFRDVFLPILIKYQGYLTHSPTFLRQRLSSAFLISLVDAISLDESFEDKETNKVLENMAIVLSRRVSKVCWDLALSLRNEIIKSMEKEKENVGGIVL